MPSERISFENSAGIKIAGIIDLPSELPRAFALFSHCFTCTKDLKAIVRISRRLAETGIGVLRFDFTGLGDSAGDFSNTTFESNVADALSAAAWLEHEYQSPKLLIGLSLGGATMMAVSNQIESARGLVTLAAPSCTKHLAEFLSQQNPAIEAVGLGDVTIGGRSYSMNSQLLGSLRTRDLEKEIRAIRLPHLIMHSPLDDTLGFYHAENIFSWSGGVKSFVTLDGADHLMVNQSGDTAFVADQIALWSSRFL